MGKSTGRIENTIRTLRFHLDEMTQKELAKRCGVTRQTIVAIEKAKYSPSLELAFQLAHVFGVPIGEVFSYTPGPNKPDDS
ncbi:MAG: transcriptional regulator [Hyphomicrobiales bacterium]|nr:MAG: transcriptional regulator [Hyphomicrobiales bacterium]